VRLHFFSTASYAATRRMIAERRPDLVVVWNLYMASMAPLLAAVRSGAPVVTHVCDKWLYFGLHDIGALLVATVWVETRRARAGAPCRAARVACPWRGLATWWPSAIS
jgi:hypothetical protein